MNDSKLKSLSEALLNIALGFWINFAINSEVFPFFGIPWNFWVYMAIGGFYTISSLSFMYGFRRWFEDHMKKQNRKGSLLESGISTGVGFLFTYVTGLLMLPYFGMHAITAVTFVTVLSLGTTWVRRYLFRRLFSHFGPNENLYTLVLRLYKKI